MLSEYYGQLSFLQQLQLLQDLISIPSIKSISLAYLSSFSLKLLLLPKH